MGAQVRMHVVLIDYENVQPDSDWRRLVRSDCLIRVLLGPNQRSIPVEMSDALQPAGTRAQYIRCLHAGKNALDFLLVFHLGRLAEIKPDADFTIVSKDSGYDSLVKNLGESGVRVRRVISLSELFDDDAVQSQEHLLNKVIDHLQKAKAARPRRAGTLRATIKNITKASDQVVESLVSALTNQGILAEEGGKVSYSLA